MSAAKGRYLDGDCQRIARSMGLAMQRPSSASGSWELVHHVWLHVSRLGKGAAMWEALTTSRWLHGQDITEPELIQRLARAVGVAGDVLAAVQDASLRELARRRCAEALDDDAFAVPYFRAGRHRYFGFDRVDDFARILSPDAMFPPLRIVLGAANLLAGPNTAEFDTDAAGGCG